jgi:hypothetical protein
MIGIACTVKRKHAMAIDDMDAFWVESNEMPHSVSHSSTTPQIVMDRKSPAQCIGNTQSSVIVLATIVLIN